MNFTRRHSIRLVSILSLAVAAGCQKPSGGAAATGKDNSGQTTAATKATPAPRSLPEKSLAAKSASQKASPNPAPVPGGGGDEAISGDCPQWMATQAKNNVRVARNMPLDWNIGKFDEVTDQWNKATSRNIRYVVPLGSQTYGNPVVAGGKVYVGTNNNHGYLQRYPQDVDLGCLLCFRESDGKFLWQHSSEKLKLGRVVDWPYQGICCAPLVEGQRLWFVTSRGEVRCLDTEGFHDDENDGPYKDEAATAKDEADVIWVFDMMGQLGVFQHNMCSCSVTAAGDILFVNTSNGVDNSHVNIPSPDAPSFIAMDKNTGKVLWTDKSPGINVLHGQWSSPTYGELGGVPQVLFAGGDGWLYSFHGEQFADGKPELLWKFDCNPKDSEWLLEGRGTRNNIIATPVIYEGRVYVAVGQDPEHGEGDGHLWCIDPTKRGDVSPQLAFHVKDLKTPIPHRRLQAVLKEKGEVARDNPNSAVVWHYAGFDQDGDGELAFAEQMHRSCGTVAIKNDVLLISDFSGLVHCLNAKTGKLNWTFDMLSESWGSPLIYRDLATGQDMAMLGDADGDISIFRLSADRTVAMKKIALKEGEEKWYPLNAKPNEDGFIEVTSMDTAVFTTPVLANNVLFVSSMNKLFAIEMTGGEAGGE